MGQFTDQYISPINYISQSFYEGISSSLFLHVPQSNLPTYNATPWTHLMLTASFTTTSTTQQTLVGLQVQLQTNKRYLIYGNLLVSSIRTANGARIGVSGSALSLNVYSIEAPTTSTSVTLGLNTTALAGSGPANDLNNYYYCPIRALVRTEAAGSPTWFPTISSEGAGGGATDVGVGIYSHVYYREYF